MSSLKSWWQRRRAKHYLKSHWHLFADIAFLIIILGLVITLIVIRQSAPQVDTSKVDHIEKNNPTATTTTTPGHLVIKAESEKNNINPGEPFSLKIHLENVGSENISGMILTPHLDSSFSLDKLVSSDIEAVAKKLSLDNLSPGEKKDAVISVSIGAATDSPRMIDWSFDVVYSQNSQEYSGNYGLPSLKLSTDLKVKAAAYYNSPLGDQLGSGPIPPMVDFPTNYWIFFEADNQGNDLSDFAITAKLPAGVTLTGNKTLSAGELNYNESQKRLVWSVKEVNVDNSRIRAGFEVQLIPSADQIDKIPPLTTNISYLATDVYTEEKLSGQLPAVSTDLSSDIINHGQGKVIK